MFDTAVEVTTALLLPFLLVTLLMTGVQELFAGVGRLRAKFLFHAMKRMIIAGSTSTDTTLQHFADSLFAHPLVNPFGDYPSYIPSKSFAAAVCGLLNGGDSGEITMAQIQKGIIALPECGLKMLLTQTSAQANNDLSTFKQALANWFDDAMDRLSGEYKRLSFYLSLLINESLALLFNINAIQIAQTIILKDEIESQFKACVGATVTNHPGSYLCGMSLIESLGIQMNLSGGSFSIVAFIGCAISAFLVANATQLWFDVLQNKLKLNLRSAGPKPSAY